MVLVAVIGREVGAAKLELGAPAALDANAPEVSTGALEDVMGTVTITGTVEVETRTGQFVTVASQLVMVISTVL